MGTYYAQLGGSRILNATRVDQSGADNADVTNWDKANHFILAVNINSGGKDTVAAQYKLRYRDGTDNPGGAYGDVSSSGEIKFGSTDLVNGAGIAVGGRKCDSQGGDTWQTGAEVEGATLSNSIDLADEYETEIHFSLSAADADDGHLYEFELYDSTNGRVTGACGATLTTASAAIQVNLDAISLPVAAVTLDVVPVTTIPLDPLGLPISAQTLDVVPGARIISLDYLPLGTVAATLTVDVPGAGITVSLDPLGLPTTALTLSVIPGAATVNLNEIALAITAAALDVVPGEKIIGLSELALPVSALNLSVIPGSVTISLNDLSLPVSAAALNVVVDIIIGLNALGLNVSAQTLSVIIETIVRLQALKLYTPVVEDKILITTSGEIFLKLGKIIIKL